MKDSRGRTCGAMACRETDALWRLNRLGYTIDEEMKLRDERTDKPFKFEDKEQFDQVANAVLEHIQGYMLNEYRMHQHLTPKSSVLLSSNYESADTLLVLLCGKETAEAGQWSRRLCVYDSYLTGSVIPFVDWADSQEMAVLVLNPSVNNASDSQGRRLPVPFNTTPDREEHLIHAWNTFCSPPPPSIKHIVIVTHLQGSLSVCNLLDNKGPSILKYLRCVAFADATHRSKDIQRVRDVSCRRFLVHDCANWKPSSRPVNEILEIERPRAHFFNRHSAILNSFTGWHCRELSAGTLDFRSPFDVFDPICNFITAKLAAQGRLSPKSEVSI